jgi:hypothetical protein
MFFPFFFIDQPWSECTLRCSRISSAIRPTPSSDLPSEPLLSPPLILQLTFHLLSQPILDSPTPFSPCLVRSFFRALARSPHPRSTPTTTTTPASESPAPCSLSSSSPPSSLPGTSRTASASLWASPSLVSRCSSERRSSSCTTFRTGRRSSICESKSVSLSSPLARVESEADFEW